MSRDMAKALEALGATMVPNWEAALREMRKDYGGKTADVLAQAFNVTRRTGERWLAYAEGRSSQKHDPTKRHPERAAALVQLMRNRRAAKRLKQARKVKAVKVKVLDKSPAKGKRPGGRLDPRPRKIGSRDIVGRLALAAQAAAELVAEGEYDRAAVVMDDAMLEAYGVPEGALQIESYEGSGYPEFE